MAAGALPAVGGLDAEADTRRRARASRSSRSPAARPSSTTTTSFRAGRTACSRPRCRRRRSSASASSPPEDRWISASRTGACRLIRSSRSSTPCSPTPSGWHDGARREHGDGADRSRALLAVLRHEAADDRVGRARPAPRTSAPHAPRRDGRGGCLLPRAVRLHAARVPGGARLDGLRRLVRALRPSLRRGRRAFGRAGIGVAHCPTSNLRLGAGVAPVRALLDAGAPVGLGVDGSASNERSDLLFDVKQALLVARGRGGPAALTCREALRIGTRGGADVLGRTDIGSIEAGKCSRPRDLADGRARARRSRGSCRRARAVGAASGRPADRRRRTTSSATATSCTPTRP